MNHSGNSSKIIYPNLRAAESAVCQKWCDENGYQDKFYQQGSWWAFPPSSVMPVRIHEIIDRQNVFARRVRIKYYSIYLSIALLPDGCVAPHNHPEV